MAEFKKEQFYTVTGASSGLGIATALVLNKLGASIVAIASAGAIGCNPRMTCYSESKGALISSTKVISREVVKQGIRVNTVSPTLIGTDMAGELERKYAEGKYPLGIGEPIDVANMIAYLLSEDAKWITSQNYIIDCGAMV